MHDNDEDQSSGSTEARWTTYKAQQHAAGHEPMSWGQWLAAGQPVAVDE